MALACSIGKMGGGCPVKDQDDERALLHFLFFSGWVLSYLVYKVSLSLVSPETELLSASLPLFLQSLLAIYSVQFPFVFLFNLNYLYLLKTKFFRSILSPPHTMEGHSPP